MNIFDIRTIILSYVITDLLCVWFVVLLWRQNRNRFAGTVFWAIDFILQAAALLLILLRGAIPDWISMIFSNILVIAGAILGFMGLERFVGKKGPQIHNYLLVVFFILIHSYFTVVRPSLSVRNLNISVALLLVCIQSVWLMWHRVEPGLRSLTFGVGVVNFLYCLVSLARIVHFSTGEHAENNYFQSGFFEALVLVSYQALFILLTYSLVLMVNKRLLMQVGTQEEKFSKAFNSAPYAITITRPSDGTIIDVNESFTAITGYDRADVIGKKTIDLHLWENDRDRVAVVDTLSKKGGVHDMEMHFRKRNGDGMIGLFSAEVITMDGSKSILSSIADITEHKKADEESRLLAKFPSENPYPVMRIEDGGKLLYANAAALGQLSEWQLQVELSVPSMLQKVVSDTMSNGTSQSIELEHGKRVYLFCFTPIADANYVNVYGIAELVNADETPPAPI